MQMEDASEDLHNMEVLPSDSSQESPARRRLKKKGKNSRSISSEDSDSRDPGKQIRTESETQEIPKEVPVEIPEKESSSDLDDFRRELGFDRNGVMHYPSFDEYSESESGLPPKEDASDSDEGQDLLFGKTNRRTK